MVRLSLPSVATSPLTPVSPRLILNFETEPPVLLVGPNESFFLPLKRQYNPVTFSFGPHSLHMPPTPQRPSHILPYVRPNSLSHTPRTNLLERAPNPQHFRRRPLNAHVNWTSTTRLM